MPTPRKGQATPAPLGRVSWAVAGSLVAGIAWTGSFRGSAEEIEPGANATEAVTRVASAASESSSARPIDPRSRPAADALGRIRQAQQLIAECRDSYAKVRDYTCIFHKRERIGGRLVTHVMQMKARTEPMSVYFKFLKPSPGAGREAIYVAGQNGGRVWVHDVGLGKLIAGTVALDPRSRRAMQDNRHPITEAGLGHMIRTIAERWAAEMTPGETLVSIRGGAKVDDRPCTMIESTHTRRSREFLFHSVKVFVDQELKLPIHFEAYDWPRKAGGAPELAEEYTYSRLKLNVGLSAHDFDPENPAYSFGRL